MPVRSELVFEYDHTSFVVSGTCSLCGERMLPPPPHVTNSADRVMSLAQQFIAHKKHRHPPDGKKVDPKQTPHESRTDGSRT